MHCVHGIRLVNGICQGFPHLTLINHRTVQNFCFAGIKIATLKAVVCKHIDNSLYALNQGVRQIEKKGRCLALKSYR